MKSIDDLRDMKDKLQVALKARSPARSSNVQRNVCRKGEEHRTAG